MEAGLRAMIYVLYDDDADGFGAAYAAWLKFKDEARYIAVERGDPPPEMEDASEIYILDFNYSLDVMKTLQERVRTVLIDHHVSAATELSGLPYAHFNVNKSAAVLSWEYFLPEFELPLFFQYIQDQDLWQWRLPFSKEVRYAVESYSRTFETWQAISGVSLPVSQALTLQRLNQLIDKGEQIIDYVRAQVSRAIENSRTAVFVAGATPRISFDPDEAQQATDRYTVPVVNATMLQSEICNDLLVLNPEAAFAAYYYDLEDGLRQWGLRSRPDGVDVSLIAKTFGGGGHKNAAGFRTFHDASYGNKPAPIVVGALSSDERRDIVINVDGARSGKRRIMLLHDDDHNVIGADVTDNDPKESAQP